MIKMLKKQEKYKAILIFGPPGAGKGTQAKLLAKKEPEKYFHLSTGDMFRNLRDNPGMVESGLSKKIHELISAGNFVPDDLTIDLLYKTLESYKKENRFNPKKQILILDGIPRNPNQVDLIAPRIDVLKIVYLVVKDYLVLVERIKSRAIKESRLDDSKEEVIYKRLGIYNQDTSAVLSKYSSNLVLKIDGLPSIKKIHKDIVSKLE